MAGKENYAVEIETPGFLAGFYVVISSLRGALERDKATIPIVSFGSGELPLKWSAKLSFQMVIKGSVFTALGRDKNGSTFESVRAGLKF